MADELSLNEILEIEDAESKRSIRNRKPISTDVIRRICQYLDETEGVENRSPLFIKRLAKVSVIGYRHLREANRIEPQDTAELLDELDSHLVKLYNFCLAGIKNQQAENETDVKAINSEAHLHGYAGIIADLIFRRSKDQYWGEMALSKMEVANNMHSEKTKKKRKRKGYEMRIVSDLGNIAKGLYQTTGDIYGWGMQWIEYKKEAVRLAHNDILRLKEKGGSEKIPERTDFMAYRQAQIGEAIYTLVTDAIQSRFGPGLSTREIEEGVEHYKSALTYLVWAQEQTSKPRGLHFLERVMEGAELKIKFLERYLPKQQAPTNT